MNKSARRESIDIIRGFHELVLKQIDTDTTVH